jgi:hypothetical protein
MSPHQAKKAADDLASMKLMLASFPIDDAAERRNLNEWMLSLQCGIEALNGIVATRKT